MNKFLILSVFLIGLTGNAFSQEILGYKLNGSVVKIQADVKDLVLEFDKLKADEDYELEDTGLCVVYGEESGPSINDKLDEMLALSGYSIQIEGIYGSFGDHMFEVRDVKTGTYIGAFSGVYSCN